METNDLQKSESPLPARQPVLPAQLLAQAAAALAAALQAMQGQTLPTNSATVLPFPSGTTVTMLINEFMRAKNRAGKSERYIATLLNALSKFHRGRGRLSISDVTIPMIETFLENPKWKARTRRNYLLALRTLFNYAVRRNYLEDNPAAAVELPQYQEKAPALHTPQEAAAALAYAMAVSPVLCRALAIAYFSGLRSAEICRLRESEIGQEFIEVTAAKAKTRARRLVPISANLRAWLDATAGAGAKLPVINPTHAWTTFRKGLKARGVPWPANVARHSFISYHLAAYQSAGSTALQTGTSESMIFRNYRELTTRAAGAAWFELKPR